MKILLAEDTADLNRAVSAALKLQGYEVGVNMITQFSYNSLPLVLCLILVSFVSGG